ncbi:hypothetical protein KSP40_PGU014169 [Platanthera guangdongensis]|uniref:Uncharacterized protein n=1 Tax=Platanthera guangdongensis TaxID=2320717 RepID=A0ABR2MA23_9ASPA
MAASENLGLSQTKFKQGDAVVATSRSDHSLLCSQLRIPFYKELDDFFASGSDVILLRTSILSTAGITGGGISTI